MNTHIMVDIETLGTRPGSVILSLGAVSFGPQGLGKEFYAVINRQTCQNAGLEEDPDTLAWWATQSEEAREVMSLAANLKTSLSLARVLNDFANYLHTFGDPKKTFIWSNGAAFDIVLLNAAYRKTGDVSPWHYTNDRCYRTLKGMEPGCVAHRTGLHHNALDDAKTQAEHAIRLINRMGATW